MNYVLQTFGDLRLGSVIVTIAAFIVIGAVAVKLYKFICDFHDSIQVKRDAFDKMREDNEMFENQLKEVQPALTNITRSLETTQSQLFEVIETQNSLIGEIKNLSETQNIFATQFDRFKNDFDEQQVNKLRDRLLQIYRFYSSDEKNPLKAWTEMEKDAFDKLFKDYEKLGGDGYMHSVVEPEMRNLEVIKMSQVDLIASLMKSRNNG